MLAVDEEGNRKLVPVSFIQVLGGVAYIPDSMKEIKMLKELMSLERIKEIKKLLKERRKEVQHLLQELKKSAKEK